jgi:Co/Zn/Cd efflux system component
MSSGRSWSTTSNGSAAGITSILIGLLIVYPTSQMLRGSIYILMEGIPTGVDPEEVERFMLANFPRIVHVKAMHVWAIVPEKILLAVKVRTKGDVYRRNEIRELKEKVQARFGFYDVYVEVYEDQSP